MMRSRPSQFLRLVSAGAVILGLAACVEPADSGKTSDTLAPLVPSGGIPTTANVALVPSGSAAAPPAQTAVLDAGSVSTATSADAQPADPPTTIPDTTLAATSTTAASGPGSYTIAASDTVYSIARRCSSSASDLATYNGWADGADHLIHPGDVIELPCTPGAAPTVLASSGGTVSTTVPASTTTVKTTTVKTGATGITVAVIAGGTYTVVAGDYLAGIASRAGTAIDAIVAVNGWANSSHAIYPGDVIKLPAKQ